MELIEEQIIISLVPIGFPPIIAISRRRLIVKNIITNSVHAKVFIGHAERRASSGVIERVVGKDAVRGSANSCRIPTAICPDGVIGKGVT